MLFAQFIAVCSASKLAEELRLSSLFRRQSCEKRGASSRPPRAHVYQLRPTTNSDKLSAANLQNQQPVRGKAWLRQIEHLLQELTTNLRKCPQKSIKSQP